MRSRETGRISRVHVDTGGTRTRELVARYPGGCVIVMTNSGETLRNFSLVIRFECARIITYCCVCECIRCRFDPVDVVGFFNCVEIDDIECDCCYDIKY